MKNGLTGKWPNWSAIGVAVYVGRADSLGSNIESLEGQGTGVDLSQLFTINSA